MRRAVLLVPVLACLLAVPALATEPKQPATPQQIVAYEESGQWDKDITAVTDKARKALDKALAKKTKKPALVFDIDDTLLSAYDCAKGEDFSRTKLTTCVVTGEQTPIKQTGALFRYALKKKVAVFIITGRPEPLRSATVGHLKAAKLTGYKGLYLKTAGDSAPSQVGYKSGERKKIAAKGYTIVANLGDQKTDLAGGFGKGYKIPNPMYTTP
jgi:acid phosphatase